MMQTRMIEDAFGKMVPMRPSYPTLDGMSFAEWGDRHKPDDEIGQVAEQVQQAYSSIPDQLAAKAPTKSRGSFKIAFYCRWCGCTLNRDYCPDHGNIWTFPILVEK